jgi:NCS2 family nucleobase:cation symporter-2
MRLSFGGLAGLRSGLDAMSARRQLKRPSDLTYAIEDSPPLYVTMLSGLQHVGIASMFLVYPLLIVKEAGASMALSTDIVSLAFIALGVATFLQCLPRGPVGSGFLCPANHTAVYLAPSLAAVKFGGLPLLFGMTVLAGLVECCLSTILRRIRPLIPPELSGLVIFFVGMAVASAGLRSVAGPDASSAARADDLTVAGLTLAIMIVLNVWAKGGPRVFCALIGIIAGYIISIATGVLPLRALSVIRHLPVIALPSIAHLHWTMQADMVAPFVVAALAVTLKEIGILTLSQRINDAEWVRPDMSMLSRGVLADGLGTVIAGFLGSLGLNGSTPSTGLSAATGVTSRIVGYAVGGLLLALGFLPMVAAVFVLMPAPVVGAALIFSACFILISGFQTMASRMLDARRTLVIGLSISAGLAAEAFPAMASHVPVAFRPIVSSSLVLGTMVALVLNLLFRIGQRRYAKITIDSNTADPLTLVRNFLDEQGRSWGARRDIMERVIFGVCQSIETIQDVLELDQSLRIEARFDEFNLDVQLIYRGEPIELPERRPSQKEIIETEAGHRRLAGYMLRRNADRVSATSKDGENILQFHFDH